MVHHLVLEVVQEALADDELLTQLVAHAADGCGATAHAEVVVLTMFLLLYFFLN